jgi:transposase-like protein
MNIEKIVGNLSETEKVELLEFLKHSLSRILSKEITVCPCCLENNFIKNGKYHDVQKYKCGNTNKVFSYKTNTVLSRIVHLDKLTNFINMLDNGILPTISAMQEYLHISRQTAFDWRNKVLSALYNNTKLDNQMIEFDEFHHPLSRKGRRGLAYSRKRGSRRKVGDNKYTGKVFMSYSRSMGKVDLHFSHIGKTKAMDVENYLGLNKDIMVFSDKHPSYRKFYRENHINKGTFKAGDHVSKINPIIHTQTVNAHCNGFDKLINRVHMGVSTKYIQNYCNWYAFRTNAIKPKIAAPKENVVNNKIALLIHMEKEKEFQYVLRNAGRTNYGDCNLKYKFAA